MGKFEKMEKLIECIEKCDFECEAGNLRGCQEWVDLKKEVNDLLANGMTNCEDTRPKNHIERMEEEAADLKIKTDKLIAFLEMEMIEPKFTDEYQRQLLAIQKSNMIDYYNTLLARIDNDKKKLEKNRR